MIQKSFKNNEPTLFVVATPIGNLQEMTPRAITILKEVDIIAAEDTRTSKKLMDYFGITTPLVSYHMHNEKASAENILERLQKGENIALISDAGYPLISDPGQYLAKEVIKRGYNLVPISGSSAFLNALVASGITTQPFTFFGFLETKDSKIREQFKVVKELSHTSIFYLSVHRVEKTLELLLEELGNREICLAREITKLHEEFIRGRVKDIIERELTLKGEFVLIIEAYQEKRIYSNEDLIAYISEEIEAGLSPSRAISKISKEYKVSKNELYNYYQLTKESQ
jgi:16S rRNA (cytidine1402-2'-O)-methyltransferase